MAAVYPVAAGVPTMSGTYNPEIFAAKIVENWYPGTFLSEISNTNYQGEITNMGDKVNIPTIPELNTHSYVLGAGIVRENPLPGSVILNIDKGRAYSFNAFLLQQKQAKIDYVNEFSKDVAERMKLAIERHVLGAVYTDADAWNKGTTAGKISQNIDLGTTTAWEVPDKATILEFIVDMKVVLSEQDVPMDGKRWLLLSAAHVGLLEKSDLKNASFAGDGKTQLRTGFSGNLEGFNIYETNCLSKTLDTGSQITNAIFGHKECLTFAMQLVHNRRIPNPNEFGDLIEGLQVYGFKVIKPEGIGHFYAI